MHAVIFFLLIALSLKLIIEPKLTVMGAHNFLVVLEKEAGSAPSAR